MAQVISLPLPDLQYQRLERLSQALGKSVGETGAMLVDESLRRLEHPHVEFRDCPGGRQAYMVGSGLAVWEVVMVAEGYQMNAARAAEHLEQDVERIVDVLRYAEDYPAEIAEALSENDSFSFEKAKEYLPEIRLVLVQTPDKPVRA